MCQDCIKFLTDAQAEAKANSSFIDSLIQNIENQCDQLGPSLSSMVRTLQKWRVFVNSIFLPQNVWINFFSPLSLQCKEYVSQYGTVVVQQLMSMVSLLTLSFHLFVFAHVKLIITYLAILF